MTTVVFDGKVLAADSKRRVVRKKKGDVENCSSCNEPIYDTVKSAVKIKLAPEGVKYKGDVVVAVATIGSGNCSSGLQEALFNNFDLHDAVRYALAFTAANRFSAYEGGLVILTKKKLFEAIVSDSSLRVTEITKFPYAVGTGSQAALVAMNYMGFTAVESVMVAIDTDQYSGGDVYSINRLAKSKIVKHDVTLVKQSELMGRFNK